MTFDSALFFAATQLVLEILPSTQNQAWQHQLSTPAARYQAYLNQICLTAILPWLQEEYEPQANSWPSAAALPSFWELVNGTAIALGAARLVLVPSETIDTSELRVPQEWVDISSWAADYYLAVQIEPDEGWVRILGYCTHQQLKTKGSYDANDRTYCLDEDEIVSDISVLWVARQLCPDEPTKAAIAPLPALPLAQAENLISRLGNLDVATPRLAIPFGQWGALIEHGGWRQKLYQQRLGLPEQWSMRQWLQSGVSEVAQQLGWGRLSFQPSLAGARSAEQTTAPESIMFRQLVIAGQSYELQIVSQVTAERLWRFELRPSGLAAHIPSGVKLRLLTEDLQPFEGNEDTATNPVDQLFVDVTLEPGEGIVWEIEPIPENYDREILRC